MRGALVVVLLVAVGGAVAFGAEPEATLPPFVVEEGTTHFVGPLRRDGTIDYVAAINDRLSRGVTTENNAAVPLVQAFEALEKGRAMHYARVREALGVERGKAALAARELGEVNVDRAVRGPWVAADDPELAKWLAGAGDVLDRVVEASKRGRYWMPLVRAREGDPMVAILLPHLNYVRQLGNGLRARAMLRLGGGDAAGFRGDAVAVVRLGRLLTEAGTLVEKLVALGVEAAGLETIRAAATGGWLPAEDLGRLSAELGDLPAGRPTSESLDLAERTFVLEFLQFAAVYGSVAGEARMRQMLQLSGARMMPAGVADVAGKDWDKALRKVNGWYDRMADAGRKEAYEERRRAWEEVSRDVVALKEGQAGIRFLLAPIEDRLIVQVVPALDRAYRREATVEAARAMTRVTVALAVFRAKTGAYPQALKELVPGCLKEVPADPLTGEGFVYKAEGSGYAMQSAGADGVDGQEAAGLSVRAEK